MVGVILSMVHICNLHMNYMRNIELFLGSYMAYQHVQINLVPRILSLVQESTFPLVGRRKTLGTRLLSRSRERTLVRITYGEVNLLVGKFLSFEIAGSNIQVVSIDLLAFPEIFGTSRRARYELATFRVAPREHVRHYPSFNLVQYRQTRVAPVSYKTLISFSSLGKIVLQRYVFFVFVFSYLLYECVPRHTGRYQTFSTSGTLITSIIQTGDLKFASGDYGCVR